MKKSNIILVSAVILAFCWTLVIGWFAASAINNFLEGKDPYFARTHRQVLESKKRTFPAPARELVISGEGTAAITIMPGKELAVLTHPRLWTCVYTDLKNGRSMISIQKLTEYNEPVIIRLPEIPSLSLDNFSEVTVKGVNMKEIHLQVKRVRSFISDSCKTGTLSLDFPRSRDLQDIYIKQANRIDTLIASVQGTGRIRLETIGEYVNKISLSDSIQVEASYDLMKRLARELHR